MIIYSEDILQQKWNNLPDNIRSMIRPSDMAGQVPITDLEEVHRSNPLIKMVFAIDKRTNFPGNDIALHVAEGTNPEIKAFIQSQLMGDNSPLNLNTKDLSDDVILNLTKNDNESPGSYASRINQYIRNTGERIKFEASMKNSDS